MGRPKLYDDDASRMRAYRARLSGKTVAVDRRLYEWLIEALEELRGAVSAAASVGDRLAAEIDTRACEDVLTGLTFMFKVRAEAMRDAQVVAVATGQLELPETGLEELHGGVSPSPVLEVASGPKVAAAVKKRSRRR